MKSDIHTAESPAREYLLPTSILDSDHPDIIRFAEDVAGDSLSHPLSAAVKLYYAVRDGIWYDPYTAFYRPEHYRASHVLKNGSGFCISKAGLLCALGRACKIPSRLGFATVRNHLATRQLLEHIGCDLFVFHGYTEFFLNGRWVKATPAFNRELCLRHGVEPLDFDGREDSVFQPYNAEKKRFMEYVDYHGEYADIPVDEILIAWKKVYGEQRVLTWIDRLEKSGGKSWRNFDTEDVVS
ncbi:MAG: transglutaminase-like domain-containing protein [Desulfobacterales bacterium]